MKLNPFRVDQVRLGEGPLLARQQANRRYMLGLSSDLLLLPYRFEAGLWTDPSLRTDIHGGWESPTSQLHGHFLGHWLAAAAPMAAAGDREIRAKAEVIIDELGRCQAENGGEWAGSIPEKYLEWIARGKAVWAPHYTVHKTFMGLIDFYKATGYQAALDIAVGWARWFHRWTDRFTTAQMDDILDFETGGMLEVWADLYGLTGDPSHRDLMDRYTRRRLFDPLLAGKDVVTNMHANTTIPEILGAARAYEVTGEPRWLQIVEAYWKETVTERGQYATGGQTCGEIWSPPGRLSARLGDKNQEHCTVYNMMRLAEFLLRWTAESKYADYQEKNLYNGILAQGHWEGIPTHGQKYETPMKGLLTYFLPLRSGVKKGWASETGHFYCCHGSLVQANATHTGGIWYRTEAGLALSQLVPSELRWDQNGVAASAVLKADTLSGTTQAVNSLGGLPAGTPDRWAFDLAVSLPKATDFELAIRLPDWLKAPAVVSINGKPAAWTSIGNGWGRLNRSWHEDVVRLEFPKGLTAVPLPGDSDLFAFLDGPVVLAGLGTEERTLIGDPRRPETLLTPDNEREWRRWTGQFRTKGQNSGLQFKPLNDIGYETYSVYFRIVSPKNPNSPSGPDR
jgi:DUF1680 family protein